MRHPVLRGLLAGAVGTVVLDIAGYADMALRGRSSSNTPAKMVDVLATMLHLPLSSQGNDSTVQNRESGLGALLGYTNGLGTGVIYGLIRSRRHHDEVSIPLASTLVGLASMAASDIPLVKLKVSDPKTWGVSGWLSDFLFHFIYGFATVTTYEALPKL